MVLWTLHRPEPCSGLAAYGSRKCTIEFVGADEGIGPYKVRREVELRGLRRGIIGRAKHKAPSIRLDEDAVRRISAGDQNTLLDRAVRWKNAV